jgi:hypothetical protein
MKSKSFVNIEVGVNGVQKFDLDDEGPLWHVRANYG